MFSTELIALCYNDVEAAKRWWMHVFDCKVPRKPPDWDDPQPSDVALTLPPENDPQILLSKREESPAGGLDHPILFTSKLTKAQEYLLGRGISPGPIQNGGGTEFFEIRDPEGNVIEICKEP